MRLAVLHVVLHSCFMLRECMYARVGRRYLMATQLQLVKDAGKLLCAAGHALQPS